MVLKEEMSYFEMMETLMHWSRYKEYEFLLKPFDKDWFESSPVDVNAYYSPEKNAISTHSSCNKEDLSSLQRSQLAFCNRRSLIVSTRTQ